MGNGDELNGAAGAITSFGEAVGTAAEKLNDVKGMEDAAGLLAKFSGGLGAIGAGLGIFAGLLGVQSDTDRILDAIAELAAQVTKLHEDMMTQFEIVKDMIELNAAMTSLAPVHARMATLTEELVRYSKNLAKDPIGEDAKLGRRNLRQLRTADIRDDVTGIYQQLTDDSLATHILKPTFDVTFGEIRPIARIGGLLYMYMATGVIADVLISSLGESDAAQPADAEITAIRSDADAFYGPKINAAFAAWQAALAQCRDKFPDNIEPWTKAQIAKPPVNLTDIDASSKWLCNELAGAWPWFDWIAILALDAALPEYTRGFDMKVVAAPGATVFVKWVEKGSPPFPNDWKDFVVNYKCYAWASDPPAIRKDGGRFQTLPDRSFYYMAMNRPGTSAWATTNADRLIPCSPQQDDRYIALVYG